jgi:ribosome-associated protein
MARKIITLEEIPEEPSKSQRKRESDALQQLGVQLTLTTPTILKKCELPEELIAALNEYRRLPNKHGAQRRQLQFIGKLMRELDDASVEHIHRQLNLDVDLEKRRFHRLEILRDQLLMGDNDTLQQALAQHPQLKAKEVAQLIRQARKEEELNQPPGSARKLFKLLRDALSD